MMSAACTLPFLTMFIERMFSNFTERKFIYGTIATYEIRFRRKGGLKPSIGHTCNLVYDCIRNVKADMKKDIANMICNSYKEFALTIDGSTIGDDTEAV